MTSQRDVIRSAVAFLLAGASASASADLASQLRDFVGYTVLEVKTIAGWRDADGKSGEGFEGCSLGRTIIFDDNKAATCSGFGFQHAFRPSAVILSRQGDFKMVVEDEIYDLQR